MTDHLSPRLALGAGVLSLAVLAAAAAGVRSEPTPAEPAMEVRSWAGDIWNAARQGDRDRLERTFEAVPAATDDADEFMADLERFRSHRVAAEAARDEDRAEAMAELREARSEGREGVALRQAVVVQTLSADLNEAFAEEEVMEVVEWAKRRVPEAERERDWIEAQELLYLLRTFYEDTNRTATFEELDEELEIVNGRVALLARYAPRVLHEMRSERAIENGEEPFDEFNPARVIDWRERIEDVDHRMLFAFLSKAADEHIEASGWRPLLEGGLESLRVLATTTALAEVFPELGEAERVNRFVARVEAWKRDLDRTPNRELNARMCRTMLNDLVDLSEETIRLEAAMLVREFGDGAMGELDTYSDIIWPDEQRRFEQQTRGDFVGVGILIRHNDKREIMVVNPLEGTPAYLAGVRPDDVIVSVDGRSTAGWSLNDAVDSITGEADTSVTLGIERDGEDDVLEIEIERDRIKIYSVKGWRKVGVEEDGTPIWDWYVDRGNNIGYIRLTQFTDASLGDLIRAWRQMEEAQGRPNGLILDLRHNPGGLLKSAVLMSNLFVRSGTIVTGEDRDKHRVWSQNASPQYAALEGVPTVVLVNKGSASASEIVAGCLQAYGAAVVIGERTFGKGSVQTIHSIPRTAGSLKLTTQYYRLPSSDGGRTPGRLVHKRPGADVWGVDPDIEVPMTAKQVTDAIELRQDAERIAIDGWDEEDEERADIDDLLDLGIDPQLQTGLLILQAQAMAQPTERHARR